MNPLTPTQQELNVRFAKALGWRQTAGEQFRIAGIVKRSYNWVRGHGEEISYGCPNYFAPENFHLVRAAVEQLPDLLRAEYFYGVKSDWSCEPFLAPVQEHIENYLKVKEVN